MTDFSKDIDTFKKYGTYSYSFDGGNNLTFNQSSSLFNQVYLSLPLKNIMYNENKIKSFYNVEFEEYVPSQNVTPVTDVASDSTIDISSIKAENDSLRTQLDKMISDKDASVNPMAIKQVILELRKLVGQGRVDSDFSEEFPFTPIRKQTDTDI